MNDYMLVSEDKGQEELFGHTTAAVEESHPSSLPEFLAGAADSEEEDDERSRVTTCPFFEEIPFNVVGPHVTTGMEAIGQGPFGSF